MGLQITITDVENISAATLERLNTFLSGLVEPKQNFTPQELAEAIQLVKPPHRETVAAPPSAPFAAFAEQQELPLPPVVPAPVAVQPPPTPMPLIPPVELPVGGVELDKDGVPYDGRIHTGTKAKNKDGTWRVKRGTDPAYLEQVTRELKAAVKAPPAPVTIPPPPATAVAAPIPPPSPQGGITTFPEFMRFVTEGYSTGQFTQAQVVAELQAIGVPSLPGLSARPDLVPHLVARLRPVA